MKKIITEGIGAFMLMFAIIMANGALAPVAVGLLLMALIYAGGRTSGAFYNPAVSVALLLQNKITRDELPIYAAAQLIGALVAAAISGFLLHFTTHQEIVMHTNRTIGTLLAEFIGAFILTYIILNVTLPKQTANNGYYGAAIGLTVTALSVMLSDVSGAVFNPAIALGLAFVGKISWGDVWLYFVCAFLGAAAASTVFTLTENE